MEFNLNDHLKTWKSNVGLLPVKLFSKANFDKNYYMLLNGGIGNFCLDLSAIPAEEIDYHSYAWSANTKNYVVVKEQNVVIYNWVSKKVETAPLNVVRENQSKFYNYLHTRSLFTEHDILPSVLRAFNRIRNFTYEQDNPVEAFSLLLTLLVRLENPGTKIINSDWLIPDVSLPSWFDQLFDDFSVNNLHLKPNVEIIFRHTAGSIFQDAHSLVESFNPELDLFDGAPSPSKLIKKKGTTTHYTPSGLVRSLVEVSLDKCALSKSNISVLDPSCGSGEFLVEVLKQLREREYAGSVRIQGYDISEIAVLSTKFLLNIQKRDYWGKRLEFNIEHVRNSLVKQWGEHELIFMNPPYISWDSLDNDLRDSVRNSLSVIHSGKPNLSAAFLLKATDSLSSEGIIGCVIPSALIHSESYAALRNRINDSIKLYIIGNLGSKVFPFILTDVSILVGGKLPNENKIIKIWTDNSRNNSDEILRELRMFNEKGSLNINNKIFNIYRDINQNDPSWKCTSQSDSELVKELKLGEESGSLVPIAKIFDVRQGIRTGANSIFKIPIQEYENLPQSEKKYFRRAIESESIQNCRVKPVNSVWFPYSSNGEPFFNEESELAREIPNYYMKLKAEKERLSKRKKKVKNWWDLSDKAPRLFNVDTIIVSGEFGNNSSFSILHDYSYVIERGYGWRIKGNKQNEDLYYFYLTILSSNFFNRLLSIFARRLYGNDIFDLGKSNVKNIPIPDYRFFQGLNHDQLKFDMIQKYSFIGRKLYQSELIMDDELNRQIQEELYGLKRSRV